MLFETQDFQLVSTIMYVLLILLSAVIAIMGSLTIIPFFTRKRINEKVEIRYIYPLSPMQGGMLFHWLKNKGDHAYFEQLVLRIDGEVNRLWFENSINQLVERHDILRTVFACNGLEEPQQVVLKERKEPLYYEDISALQKEEAGLYLEDFQSRDRQRGFDLTADMLMRFSLFKVKSNAHWLVWSFHHILSQSHIRVPHQTR